MNAKENQELRDISDKFNIQSTLRPTKCMTVECLRMLRNNYHDTATFLKNL